MPAHTPRYSSMDAKVSCSCGWSEQAQNRRDGLVKMAAHMGWESNDAYTYRKSQEAKSNG